MSRVKLVGVTKSFGGTVAVDHVSFSVESGEFFALLGPSGCGKTTTLRIIAGLETPDEGEVYIDDELVNNVHPKDRNVAMVFQNYALYPHMTVFDNIAFPLIARRRELGLDSGEIRKRVYEVAKFLQIEELLSRYPSQLSGGQQQRVALARALVRKPRVWLLDEPLSNLDAKLRVYMRAELKRLQRALNVTTIYVTHDQVEAMSMADRIAVMNKGRVVQIGKPIELYQKPADLFVATFIGTPPMNIIECEIHIISESAVKLECPGFTHEFKEALAKHIISSKIASGRVLLGIRPKNIRVASRFEGLIKGRVAVAEVMGEEQILLVQVDDALIRVKEQADRIYDIGSEVGLEVDFSSIHLFDPKTGKAII